MTTRRSTRSAGSQTWPGITRSIRGIVAYAPLHRGRAAEPGLAAVAAEPLVVGVRWLLQGRPREEITGKR